MGVPKFFRSISERYPCINETLKENQIPEFDNLYLDMNGIIHVCSHDDSLTYCTSEEHIFSNIFRYVELMFRLIQPKKIFMMAVDGVAPRAKMNQQRGRRFRTAKDAEEAERKLIASGEQVPPGMRFDSNCITPGTEFMARLHEQLKYFIVYKVSTDKLWQKPKIVYSGHNVPGEGEHKIMDYIRYLRSQDDWNPSTRHCLHGLDADLIMLGLCTHEPNFSLLREEVKFTKKSSRPKNPEEIQFFLLHLSLLRDYLDCEFQALKTTLPFPYDLEKIIDDWVLMGFLVGNDFIPPLPNLHIGNDALHLLYESYINILPSFDGYINEGGVLNLERFEMFLDKLSSFDLNNYKEISMDLKYLESKTGKKKCADTNGATKNFQNAELMKMIQETQDMLGSDEEDYDDDDEDSDAAIAAEFSEFKVDYYKNKLSFENVTKEVMMEQAEGYIRAIVWNLMYYYNGCQSWSWYFPHHYSPYLSDLKGFKDWKFDFPDDKPFLPFQQLLAVLPAASRNILPKAFQELMTSPDSPIVDYYPPDFETDLNGKKQEWEAVVLIPFIKEETLIKAMEPCLTQLSEEERLRNTHGPLYIYEYTSDDSGKYKSPDFFPDVERNFSKFKEIWSNEIWVPKDKLVKGLYPGALLAQAYGFPTLKHIPFKSQLKENKVRVFQQPSRGKNMVLFLEGAHKDKTDDHSDNKRSEDEDKVVVDSDELREISERILGKEIYVCWPHLMKAKVTGVASVTEKYSYNNKKRVHDQMSKYESYQWGLQKVEIVNMHHSKLGIELGNTGILVYAQTVIGVRYSFDYKNQGIGRLNYLWSKNSKAFPYQTIVTDINMTNLPLEDSKPIKLEEVFYPGFTVFLMCAPHYGAIATVNGCSQEGRVEVEVHVPQDEPDFSKLDFDSQSDAYYTGQQAAVRLGISSHFLSRITGTIFIQSSHTDSDKTNIGLNLKFNKTNKEVVGFTKKVSERQWLYSEKCVNLINNYMFKFPKLFDKLSESSNNDVYFKDDVFPDGDGDEQVKSISQWLKEQDFRSAEQRSCGSNILSDKIIKQIEEIVIKKKQQPSAPTTVFLQVKPHALHIPKAKLDMAVPDLSATHETMDRIVNVRESHVVPLGTRGTIIGIEKKEDDLSTLYDILFDDEIPCGLTLFTETKRCYRLAKQAFINISHGLRLQTGASRPSSDSQNHKRSDSNNEELGQSQLEKQKPNDDQKKFVEFFSSLRNQSHNQVLNKLIGARGNSEEPISLRPQTIPVPGVQPAKNVDAEFHAMWDQLQKKLPATSPSPLQPLPAAIISPQAVSEQTNALKKALRISDDETSYAVAQMSEDQSSQNVTCDHLSGSCCKELSIHCQRMNVAFPDIKHMVDLKTEEVSCVLHFSGGFDFIGPKCKTKSEAFKRASCLAAKDLLLGYNGKILSKIGGTVVPPGIPVPVMPSHGPFQQGIMSMGRPAGPPAVAGSRVIIPIMKDPLPNIRGNHVHGKPIQNLLPNPPQQWCQPGVNGAKNMKNQDIPQQPPNHQMRKTSNPFVPLQAQTAAMMRGASVENKSKPNTNRQSPFSGGPQGHKWVKNAASSAFVPSKPTSRVGQGSSTVEKSQQQPKETSSRRPRRARIAANFSKPLEE